MDYSHLIAIEPGKRSGQPCIRGMRITVRDVFEYLAGGMTVVRNRQLRNAIFNIGHPQFLGPFLQNAVDTT